MGFVEIACPLCESTSHLQHRATDSERRIVVCRHCDLAFVNPQPDDAYLDAIYARDYYEDNGAGTGYQDYAGLSGLLTQIARKNIATIAELHPRGGRLLDVGCATGEFLAVAGDAGWQAEGVELAPDGRQTCQDKGLTVVGERLTDLPANEQYDVITYWDVLEHVTNPMLELGEAHRRLASGGLFATTMPNYGSLRSLVQRGRWWGFYTSREHLFFFTPRSLAAALEKAGFRVIRTATTTVDIQPLRPIKDLVRGRMPFQSGPPPVTYFESRRTFGRLLERANLGHVLFMFAERLP
jgi:2-polyprenyl-3-methyl-5-hydroxy-6-metoxy-1,4-benzoquinol methylase